MYRDQEIFLFNEKIKAMQHIGSVLELYVDDSEFKKRMAKLIKSEMNETFIKLESVLIKSVTN